jgi:hypothetical protein
MFFNQQEETVFCETVDFASTAESPTAGGQHGETNGALFGFTGFTIIHLPTEVSEIYFVIF